MKSLYGTRENEIYGTDGTTYDNLTAFVFASYARLTIQKLDGATNAVLVDLPLWKVADGPGNLAGEVNVGGNFTYGYVCETQLPDPASHDSVKNGYVAVDLHT